MNGGFADYSVNGGELTVMTGAPSGIVKFYVSAEKAGDYAVDARLSFSLEGRTVNQPLGAARVSVANMNLNAPHRTSRETVTVSGSAMPRSEVTVYVNDEAVGTATANGNGNWWTEVELLDHYLLQYYQIRAESTNRYGITAQSDTVGVWYDAAYVQVSKITMYNTATTEFETVFDFINPSTVSPYYNMWPGKYVDFTFKIEFLGDVDDVVLYVYTTGGNTYTYDAQYDPESGLWLVAAKFYNFDDAPVNVGVDYTVKESDRKLSREEIDDIQAELNAVDAELKADYESLGLLLTEMEKLTIDDSDDSNTVSEKMSAFLSKIDEYETVMFDVDSDVPDDTLSDLPDLKNMTETEVANYMASLEAKMEQTFAAMDQHMNEYEAMSPDLNVDCTTKSCEGVTEKELIDNGFDSIKDDAGNMSVIWSTFQVILMRY